MLSNLILKFETSSYHSWWKLMFGLNFYINNSLNWKCNIWQRQNNCKEKVEVTIKQKRCKFSLTVSKRFDKGKKALCLSTEGTFFSALGQLLLSPSSPPPPTLLTMSSLSSSKIKFQSISKGDFVWKLDTLPF